MAYDFKKFKEEKEKISSYLSSEYKSIQTGTATPQVLDLININELDFFPTCLPDLLKL